MRYDADSAFGGHTTGQASAAWTVRPGSIPRASYGGGFKAPSLYQLYGSYGNPGLQPERANGWDAGVEQHPLEDRLVLQATYFGRDTSDLIEFVGCYVDTGLCATRPYGFYRNVDRTRAEGNRPWSSTGGWRTWPTRPMRPPANRACWAGPPTGT